MNSNNSASRWFQLLLGERQKSIYRSRIRKNSEFNEFLRIQLRIKVDLILPLALIFALASQICLGQTAQEIMERSNQAMDAPIKYRLNSNGTRCTVIQKRLDDGSMAVRMELGSSPTLVRVDSRAGSFEIYPNSKSVIDVGFMQPNSNSQISVILGLPGASVSITEGELKLVSEVEFESKQCWQLSQTMPDESPDPTTKSMSKPSQNKNVNEKRYYVEKKSHHLVCVESFSKTGQRILQLKMDMIEKPDEISSDLFMPPADFEMQKPQSIIEYLSAREQMKGKQFISQMRDEANAARAKSAALRATITANLNATRKWSSSMHYAFPIFMVLIILFFGVRMFWIHRTFADRMKSMMANYPANMSTFQADIEKATDVLSVSNWSRFTGAPLVLKAFVIYSICATVFALLLPFWLPVGSYSSQFSVVRFLLPLVMAHLALFRKETRRIVNTVAFILVMFATIELSRVGSMHSIGSLSPSAIGVGSQYVAIQAVMGVVIPIAWAMLFYSPSMRKWLRAKSDHNEQTNQIALTDLFYFMIVTCLASMASVAIVGALK